MIMRGDNKGNSLHKILIPQILYANVNVQNSSSLIRIFSLRVLTFTEKLNPRPVTRSGTAPTPLLATPAKKKRIYVVDDELLIARTLCLILERAGYQASMFLSAEAAFDRVRHAPPDLVLSDVVLKGKMTGIDLAETLLRRFPNIKILLISGQANTSELINSAILRGSKLSVHAKPPPAH